MRRMIQAGGFQKKGDARNGAIGQYAANGMKGLFMFAFDTAAPDNPCLEDADFMLSFSLYYALLD